MILPRPVRRKVGPAFFTRNFEYSVKKAPLPYHLIFAGTIIEIWVILHDFRAEDIGIEIG